MKKEEKNVLMGGALAALALGLMYLLSKGGLLHASVSADLLQPVPGTNVLPADKLTGAPQYDSRSPATVPESEAFAIAPIDGPLGQGQVTSSLIDPTRATCPLNYVLWKNAADGKYWCLPQ